MSALEWRATASLAAIFGLRMFGMFIILPVFALYAESLPGGRDHTLVGIALGAYGLTQAILQVPLGWLSDRWGRKPTIYLGLLVFAAGSLLAAVADDIGGVILGRVVQGAGAISAAVIALLADLTREEHRTKAMAVIGMTIGAVFALSMIGGPLLNRLVGVPGIFLVTGVLALLAMAAMHWLVPHAAAAPAPAPRAPAALGSLLRDANLVRLNVGIFVLHSILMALWVVVPFELRAAGLPVASHWMVYLPVMVGAAVLMVPPMIRAERSGRMRIAFLGAIAVLIAGQLVLALAGRTLAGVSTGLLLFFTAFNLLEASLPSLLTRTAPAGSRGAAIGVYSSLQFLGTFVGASAGGFVSSRMGAHGVYLLCVGASLLWLIAAWGMHVPRAALARTYRLPALEADAAATLQGRLAAVSGVREAVVPAGHGVAYLKVEKSGFDEAALLALIGATPPREEA